MQQESPLTDPSLALLQGLDSGYAGGEDEMYNVYDQAWRKDKDLATSLYRPSKNIDKEFGEDLDKIIKSNRLVLCILALKRLQVPFVSIL